MSQQLYEELCCKVKYLEDSLKFINSKTIDEYQEKLKKVNRLLNDEYRYGSSNYDIKCIIRYIDQLSSLYKQNYII